MEEIIYILNGEEYTRQDLIRKFGEDKIDKAIEKFGFKVKEEKLSDKHNFVYELNGDIYSRKELEVKFKDKTDKAIKKFGFTPKIQPQEVDYELGSKAPKTEVEAEVDSEVAAVPEEPKKKENFVSEPVQKDSVSNTSDVQGSTSLATEPTTEPEEVTAEEPAPFFTGEAKIKAGLDGGQYGEIDQLKENLAARDTTFSNVAAYDQATKLSQEDLEKAETSAKEKLDGSFWESFSQGATKAMNLASNVLTFGLGKELTNPETYKEGVESEAKIQLEKEGKEVTPENLKTAIKQIAYKNELKGVKETKTINYIKSLSEKEKESLNINSVYKYKTLEMQEKVKVMELELDIKKKKGIESRLAANKSLIESIEAKGEKAPQEIIDLHNTNVALSNEIAEKYQDLDKVLQKNLDKRIEVAEAVDLIKRNYGFLDNMKATIATSTGDLMVAGYKGAKAYGYNAGAALSGSETAKQRSEAYALEAQQVREDTEKVREIYRPRMQYTDIEGIADVGYFMAQETATQAPILAAIANPISMAGGITAIGVTSGGGKFSDMKQEERGINPKDYSLLQELAVPFGWGASEAILGALPTATILQRAVRGTVGRTLLGQGYVKGLKVFVKDNALEVSTEVLTTYSQNILDRDALGKKDVKYTDNLDHTAWSTLASSPVIIGGTKVMGEMTRPFLPKSQIEEMRAGLAEVMKLQDAYNNASSPEVKKLIEAKINKVNKKNEALVNQVRKGMSEVDEKRYKEVNRIAKRQAVLQIEGRTINKDKGLSKDQKKILIEGLSAEFNDLEAKRNEANEAKPEAAPVEETPVEETPVEETPVEETPVEDFDTDTTEDEAELAKLKKFREDNKDPNRKENRELWDAYVAAGRNIKTLEKIIEGKKDIAKQLKKKAEKKPEADSEALIEERNKKKREEEDKIHAEANKGKPKAILRDNKIEVNDGEVLDIEIYDAEHGKVENVKDRKRTDRLSLNVVDNNGEITKNIGTLALWKKPDGTWYANIVDVIGEYRRLGIATAMYDFAEANGFEIVDSDDQTDRGRAFAESRKGKTKPKAKPIQEPKKKEGTKTIVGKETAEEIKERHVKEQYDALSDENKKIADKKKDPVRRKSFIAGKIREQKWGDVFLDNQNAERILNDPKSGLELRVMSRLWQTDESKIAGLGYTRSAVTMVIEGIGNVSKSHADRIMNFINEELPNVTASERKRKAKYEEKRLAKYGEKAKKRDNKESRPVITPVEKKDDKAKRKFAPVQSTPKLYNQEIRVLSMLKNADLLTNEEKREHYFNYKDGVITEEEVKDITQENVDQSEIGELEAVKRTEWGSNVLGYMKRLEMEYADINFEEDYTKPQFQETQTLEWRLTDYEKDLKNPESKKKFNEIEKELEKREWESIMNAPLKDVQGVLEDLENKNFRPFNGWGAFIDVKDIRETKKVAKKYLEATELSDRILLKDFKDALFGNPSKWHADGLQLRESATELAKRGRTLESLINDVKAEFKKDGFDEATATATIKGMLAPIFEGATEANKEISETNEKINEENHEISVRSLAEMQEGQVSAAVFGQLEKGVTLNVGGKNYTVKSKSKKPLKKTGTKKDGETYNYTEVRVVIKPEDGGKSITSTFRDFGNGNISWGGVNSNNQHEQFSRDIEGDILRDLVNENNQFHENSDSYKLADKTVQELNAKKSESKPKEKQAKPKSNEKAAQVKEVYDQTPKLSKVGTEDQYREYTETIFPESTEQSVLYHGSPSENIETFKSKGDEGYKKRIKSGVAGVYLIDQKAMGEYYRDFRKLIPNKKGRVYPVLINVKNVQEGKVKFTGKHTEDVKNSQAVTKKEFKVLQEKGIDALKVLRGKNKGVEYSEVVVFDPANTHILGSKNDIKGFKKFVADKTGKSKSEKVTQEIKHGKGTFKVVTDKDGNVKIYGKGDREIKEYNKPRELKSGKITKGAKNATYAAVYAKANGTLTNSQINEERIKLWNKVNEQYTPTTAEEIVQIAFGNGAKVTKESASKESGENSPRMLWATGMKGGDKTVINLAHDLYQSKANEHLKFSDQEYRNAIIKTLMSFSSLEEIRDGLIEANQQSNNEVNEAAERQEMAAYMNGLSAEMLSLHESAEFDDSINELSTAEQNILYEQEYAKQLQSLSEEQQAGIYEEIARNESKGVLAKSRGDGKSRAKTSPEQKEVARQIKEAEQQLKAAKTALKNKGKLLDKSLMEDQEDIFGNRKSQQESKLFDERIDIKARNKATESERQAVEDAQENLRKLRAKGRELKETNEVTSEMDFNENDNTEKSNKSTENKRQKHLITERMPIERRPPIKSPRKLNVVIEELATALEATLIYARTGSKRTAGAYYPKTALTRIAQEGDLDTVAHELGHFLDDRFNIVGSIPFGLQGRALDSLKWFSDRGGSNPPSRASKKQKQDYLEREGLAEFARAYMFNNSRAKIQAPELYEHFETVLPPKTLKSLQKYGDAVVDHYNAPALEMLLANVKDLKDVKQASEFEKWIRSLAFSKKREGTFGITWLDQLSTEMLSSWTNANKGFSHVAYTLGHKDIKPSQDFKILSRVFAGLDGKINMMFGNGLANADNKVVKYEGGVFETDETGMQVAGQKGTRMNMAFLIGGFDISSGESLNKEINMSVAYMISERTIELYQREDAPQTIHGAGAGVHSDIGIASEYVQEIKALKETNREQYDRIVEGGKRYRFWADTMMQYARDKGRISEQQYESIKENNQFYVSMTRVTESSPLETSMTQDNKRSGGAVSSVKKLVHQAKGSAKMMENPYHSLLHNTALIVRESDRNEIMQSFINPIKEANNRWLGEGSPINFSQIAWESAVGDKHKYTIYFDGKAEEWSFDKAIYKSLKGADISNDPVMDILSILPTIIRTTVTKFPVFGLRNVTRDTFARLVLSRDKSNLLDMLNTASHEEIFTLFGGSQAGFYGDNKTKHGQQILHTAQKLTKSGNVVTTFKNMARGYDRWLENTENKNRIAEFKAAYRAKKKLGWSDKDAGYYAAFQARDLMDFAEAGRTMRQANRLIPFLNAGVQGLRRGAKSAKEDLPAFIGRTIAYTIVPTLISQSMASLMGYQEEYEKQPAYMRDLYWMYKLYPSMEGWITIPKPFELGTVSTIVDRTISYVKGNENAYEGLEGTLKHSFMPFDESSPMGGYKPIAEAYSNHNFFTENAIVPVWEEGKMLELKDGKKYASRMGQLYSKVAGGNTDPRYADHFIQGYGTYFGGLALALSDLGKEDSKNKLNLQKTGFYRHTAISNSVDVQAVSDLVKELGERANKDVKGLRYLMERYYTSESKSERRELQKKIYKSAKRIREDLEKKKAHVVKYGKVPSKTKTVIN